MQQGVADLQLTDIAPARRGARCRIARISTPAAFEEAVEQCKEYISAGDIFQVVLSQRLETETHGPAVRHLPHAAGGQSEPVHVLSASRARLCLVGSSPEIMVRVEGDQVTIRPLAGTRRRGKTEEEDDRLADELLADPKERAEHVMLVDLGRNDVGRVARYGTVQLSDVMTVERYSHVMHMCSNVTGQLAAGQDARSTPCGPACRPAR